MSLKSTPLRPGKPPQRRKPLRAKTTLKPRKPTKRKTRLPAVNRARKARLYAVQFGALADVYRGLPCATCGKPAPSVPSHVRHTCGAGGTAEDAIPQCDPCHMRFHGGRETYAAELSKTSRDTLRRLEFPALVAAGDFAGLAEAYSRKYRTEES